MLNRQWRSNSVTYALWVQTWSQNRGSHQEPLLSERLKCCYQIVQKLCLHCKNLDDWARSGRTKTGDSEFMLQVLKANPVSSNQRVSGELGISPSSVVCQLDDFSKSFLSCWNVPHVNKILLKIVTPCNNTNFCASW